MFPGIRRIPDGPQDGFACMETIGRNRSGLRSQLSGATWEVSLSRSYSGASSAGSVHRDWIGWLPEPKQAAFDLLANELEARYLMFSVTLDEAISLRKCGSQSKALQNISIVPALCGRLTSCLQSMFCSFEVLVKCNGLVPNVAPLNPAHFLRQRNKYLARKNSLLSRVLLTSRSQFLFKISLLQEMVSCLGDDFCESAQELLSDGATPAHSKLWMAADTGHFDLNTCLRESLVMLRCLLRVLPDIQVLDFKETMALQMAAPEAPRTAARIGSPSLESTTSP